MRKERNLLILRDLDNVAISIDGGVQKLFVGIDGDVLQLLVKVSMTMLNYIIVNIGVLDPNICWH